MTNMIEIAECLKSKAKIEILEFDETSQDLLTTGLTINFCATDSLLSFVLELCFVEFALQKFAQ